MASRSYLPLVSCIMPTANRRRFMLQAIRYFQAQDYPNGELIIVDDGSDCLADLKLDDSRIRYFRLESKNSLGSKRNLACDEARGEIIVHWDDDDWMADWRLSYQVTSLLSHQAEICGLDKLFFYEPSSDRAWQYVYPGGGRSWVAGATLCYRKEFWARNPFPAINVGEDTRFVWSSDSKRMIALENTAFYVAIIHPWNTSLKRTQDPRYRSCSPAEIRNVTGEDLNFYIDVLHEGKDQDTPQR
jgi:glycosyltransferase involved in cell wall biosynthesis